MFHRTVSLASVFLSLALGMALPAVVRAQLPVDPVPRPHINPTTAAADKAFPLILIGAESGECHTSFSRESVTVVGNRINLSYVANSVAVDPPIVVQEGGKSPGPAKCAVPLAPEAFFFGPGFMIPALKSGTYEVWATRMYECLYSAHPCEIAVKPVFAGQLTVLANGEIKYSINPASAPEGKGFDLSLLSYQFNCGTTFDNLSVVVQGDELILTFLDHEKSGVACPAIYKPYGPAFKMPALKAGTYKVTAARLPDCYPCKRASTFADAGTLTITGENVRHGWHLKQRNVLAGKPFKLQLLNEIYGNCQTSFSHKSITSNNGIIVASFLAETDTNIVCITDIRPHGPTYDMAALNVGIYPVFVNQMLECQVTAPFCAIRMPMPYPTDTLVVSQSLSAMLSDLRAGAPKADLMGSRAAVTLPEGIGGTWKAELLALNGRIMASSTVNAEGGQRTEFELGLEPRRGVWLLRLSAPDGDTHMIPVIRKD